MEWFVPGVNGSFGAELLPGIVAGPPRGGGEIQGSLDVLALGIGGSLVLRFDQPVICDGPGVDFTVFENAFHSGSPSGPIFTEFVYVAVSQNGVDFTVFPFDPITKAGLAGQTPVFSHPDNDISPLDPAVSGGDSFDLTDVGLAWAAYVRITDVDGAIADVGDLPQFRVAPNAGADIDAVAAVNACVPSDETPTFTPLPTLTPTPSPTMPVPNPTETPTTATATAVEATATATLSPTAVGASPTPTESPILLPGDLNGDGAITGADAAQLVGELYDGDGDVVAAAAGGSVASGAAADVNGDGYLTAADVAALTGRRSE
ncbi:MAG: dockerin type I domain-containing protein [Candidatus Binatia bacterium]